MPYDHTQKDFHLIFLHLLIFFSSANAGAIVQKSTEQNRRATTINAAAIENSQRNECKDQI